MKHMQLILLSLVVVLIAPVSHAPGGFMAIDNPSGVTDGDISDNPNQPRSIDEAIALEYERMATRVNDEVALHTKRLLASPDNRSSRFRRARAAELAANLDRILGRYGRDAQKPIEESAQAARRHGLRVARRNIREIGPQAAAAEVGQSSSFAFINERAVELAVRDSFARLSIGATQHVEKAKRVFVALSESDISSREDDVTRAITDGIALGKTTQAERSIRELFRGDEDSALSYRQLGSKQITVGKATMSVREYARTVMITRSGELSITAGREAQADAGFDLQQCVGTVTKHFCTRSVGVVFVLGPARDGYPSIDELPNRGSMFHPRCRKSFRAVDPSIQKDVAAVHRRAVTAWNLAKRNGSLTEPLATT